MAQGFLFGVGFVLGAGIGLPILITFYYLIAKLASFNRSKKENI